jgi:hypothetical protein
MARPHILFIQAQNIPWRRGLYGSGRPDVRSKMLSVDPSHPNDSTCIVRYPKGWQRRDTHFVGAHEEFLVLEGSIRINGIEYGTHAYGFLPAGHLRKAMSSKNGAVLLTTFSGKPVHQRGAAPRGLYDKRLLIEYTDTLKMTWDASLADPVFAAGVAIKPLRTDPDTGESSFLYTSPAHRVPKGMLKPKWTHSMIEEIYCIDGEYVWGDCGVMGPGGYVWWRENEWHGPAGTVAGYNLWVRTVNGPLDNIVGTKLERMTWNPKYRPNLPPHLKKLARPYARPANY